MAINNKINDLIKQFLYIIYTETYQNKTNSTFIERYVAKHPLLKPELIVINDQIQGFKKVSKKVMSLEEFPIYLEIEGMDVIENLNLFDVNNIPLLSNLFQLSNIDPYYTRYKSKVILQLPNGISYEGEGVLELMDLK